MSKAHPPKPASPIVSLHALDRWKERFEGTILPAFALARYAGRAKSGADYWITKKYKAAFVVKENTILTVYPAKWAKAYLKRNPSKRAA